MILSFDCIVAVLFVAIVTTSTKTWSHPTDSTSMHNKQEEDRPPKLIRFDKVRPKKICAIFRDRSAPKIVHR